MFSPRRGPASAGVAPKVLVDPKSPRSCASSAHDSGYPRRVSYRVSFNVDRFKNTRLYVKPTGCRYRRTTAHSNTPWISTADNPNVTDASADSRLGAFHALAYGAKVTVKLDGRPNQPESESSVGVEYYQRTLAKSVAGSSALKELDSYSGFKAIPIYVGFRYESAA